MIRTFSSHNSTLPWSVRMADSVIKRPNPTFHQWHYETGLMLQAIEKVGEKTGDEKYFEFVKKVANELIDPDGNILGYNMVDYNLDQINSGKILFPLYQKTRDQRYQNAILTLREQLRWQPRTTEGGFWHKHIYPYQMWLDGVYMASPFLAQYAQIYGEPQIFDEIVKEIGLMEKWARDPKTGLLYHGWDESKKQRWANPATGCSPHFWGRAIGWYAMALVDVLDYLPNEHPGKAGILAIMGRLAEAVAAVQDGPSGLWYQLMALGGQPGNYLEASVSSMFVYAYIKAVKLGYLDKRYLEIARKAYQGILDHFIEVDQGGEVNLHWVCSVGGLGNIPYRDGSYEYYLGEKIATNDNKGVGPFILASTLIESIL